MENRSNNVLVGGVVLALVAVAFGFIIWIAGFSGPNVQKFDIFFKTSVSGLAKGSAVTYAGVPVGSIEDITLVPNSPEFVRVLIDVKDKVPILQGTTATIAGVGFTGVSQINLDGGLRGASPITEPGPNGIPVIPTKPGALGELLNSAPVLLEKISTIADRMTDLLDDRNQKSLHNILSNVDKLTGQLAEQGPEIRQTMEDARVAIQQAGAAATKFGVLADNANGLLSGDVKVAVGNLNKTIQSAQHSMETLDATIGDARPGLKAFSNQTVPEVSQLVRDLSEMAEALTNVARRLDRGGAGSLIGGSKLPDYKPRK